MLHGPECTQVDLSFSVPSICAERVEQGSVDLGLVPVTEIARQGLEIVPGVGITCIGAVRSILLFSSMPWRKIRTLAVDASSRTSVELARVILRERYGAEPEIVPYEPVLENMLSEADAALIIGDPALRLTQRWICGERREPQCEWLDLGAEWLALSGLPMVFAAWAGKPGLPLEALQRLTRASYEFGRTRIGDIITQETPARDIGRGLALQYFAHHIRYELGPQELHGFETFLRLANLKTVHA